MRRSWRGNEVWLRAAVCALLSGACESEPPQTNEGKPATPSASGQTGSPGAVECYESQECLEGAEGQVASLTSPTVNVRRFVSSACEQTGVIEGETSRSGPTCVCRTAEGGWMNIGPAGAACYTRGRTGNCLWKGDEFSGCDTRDANSCSEVCAELERRYEDDAVGRFEASVLHAACVEHRCRVVLKIEGRCYPASAVGHSDGYDCGLGAEAILRADDEVRKQPPQPVRAQPPSAGWEAPTLYVDGTRGFVEVGVSYDAYGAFRQQASLYASAQFADVRGAATRSGEVVDALGGLDDCGAFATQPVFQNPELDFFHVAEASIESEGETFAVEPTLANNQWFSSYAADLSAETPRYGSSYRFRAQGGGLREPLSVPVHLPEALTISSLLETEQLPKGPLALRWTGRGDAPLHLLLWVERTLRDSLSSYRIECLLRDDGEQVIPEQVLSAAPDGIVTATFTRSARAVETSGSQRFLSVGNVTARHRFALGERCEKPEVRAACERYADHQAATYAACGAEPPPRETTCPAYLATSCEGCVEYFECLTRELRCVAGGLMSSAFCSCP